MWSSYSNSESKAIPEGKKINRTKIQGVFFILLSLLIVTVSALVYESALQTVSQTIQDVAGSFTVTSPALGTIDELDTRSYTKGEVAALGNAISITTAKDNVYLHLDSNIDTLSTYYATYSITVKCATVPGSSTQHSVGETVATMTIVSPDSGPINLDKAGLWTFDFEITTTANSVSSTQGTSASITVTAESS